MRLATLVWGLILLSSAVASAGPRLYVTPAALVGLERLHFTTNVDETKLRLGIRAAIGLRFSRARLGLAADLTGGAGNVFDFGIEGGYEWPLSPCWWLGTRGLLGLGRDQYRAGLHPRIGAGVVARHGALLIGVDLSAGREHYADIGRSSVDLYRWDVTGHVGPDHLGVKGTAIGVALLAIGALVALMGA
jgi:hypothetical protein